MKHIKLVSKADETTDATTAIQDILTDPIGWLKEQLGLEEKDAA